MYDEFQKTVFGVAGRILNGPVRPEWSNESEHDYIFFKI